jgi:hypothetical protein
MCVYVCECGVCECGGVVCGIRSTGPREEGARKRENELEKGKRSVMHERVN